MLGNFRDSVMYKVIYPVAVYFILYNLLFTLFNYLIGQADNAEHILGLSISPLYCAGISAAITGVVMFILYRNANVYSEKPYFNYKTFGMELVYIIGAVLIGVALNIAITNMPIMDMSESFKDANAFLSDGDFVAKIVSNVIIIPLMEELVFRGIVCGEIEKKYNDSVTIFISALIFGLLHMNWVQMIYAFIIGLYLGFVYQRTHKLWVTYAGHALLNLTVLILVNVIFK